MKKILPFFALLFVCATAFAQDALTVIQKDGQSYKFNFADKPVITYTETDLVLTTTSTEVQYPIADIQKLTFKDSEETKVETVSEPVRDETFTVYSLEGKVVKTFKYPENGDMNSGTEGLPAGIYIIKSKSVTYKTIRR